MNLRQRPFSNPNPNPNPNSRNYYRMIPAPASHRHQLTPTTNAPTSSGIHPSDMQFMQSIAHQLFNFAPSHPGQHEIDVTFTTEPRALLHDQNVAAAAVASFDENNYFVADDYPQRSGLSVETITSMPVYLARGKQKQEMCSVCRCDYVQDRFYRQLVCGHSFHPHCIAEALTKNVKCPVCRSDAK